MSEIVLSLPAPISVNRTRRIDWRAHRTVSTWQSSADGWFLSQKRSLPPAIVGPYELTLTLAEGSRIDADNACKLVIDAVRRFRLVTDDNPKHMRRLVVEFGDVTGCRVTLRPWQEGTR
jgi:hypothetical protein